MTEDFKPTHILNTSRPRRYDGDEVYAWLRNSAKVGLPVYWDGMVDSDGEAEVRGPEGYWAYIMPDDLDPITEGTTENRVVADEEPAYTVEQYVAARELLDTYDDSVLLPVILKGMYN